MCQLPRFGWRDVGRGGCCAQGAQGVCCLWRCGARADAAAAPGRHSGVMASHLAPPPLPPRTQRRLPRLCDRPRVPRGAGGRTHCAGAGAHHRIMCCLAQSQACAAWHRARPPLRSRADVPQPAVYALPPLGHPSALGRVHSTPRCPPQPLQHHLPKSRPPAAAPQDGDTIRIDAEKRTMDILNVDDAELQRRWAGVSWCRGCVAPSCFVRVGAWAGACALACTAAAGLGVLLPCAWSSPRVA